VLSDKPEGVHALSDEYAVDMSGSVWFWIGSPIIGVVHASQIRIVLSLEPETMCAPSGEHATDQTSSV
jgi:hypothetical protein